MDVAHCSLGHSFIKARLTTDCWFVKRITVTFGIAHDGPEHEPCARCVYTLVVNVNAHEVSDDADLIRLNMFACRWQNMASIPAACRARLKSIPELMHCWYRQRASSCVCFRFTVIRIFFVALGSDAENTHIEEQKSSPLKPERKHDSTFIFDRSDFGESLFNDSDSDVVGQGTFSRLQ